MPKNDGNVILWNSISARDAFDIIHIAGADKAKILMAADTTLESSTSQIIAGIRISLGNPHRISQIRYF